MRWALSTSRHRNSTSREWQCISDYLGGAFDALSASIFLLAVVVTKLAMGVKAMFRRSDLNFSSSLDGYGWVNRTKNHSDFWY